MKKNLLTKNYFRFPPIIETKVFKAVIFFVLLFSNLIINAQANFTTNNSATQLADAIRVNGITITNPVVTVGSPTQLGVFSNGNVGAGLDVDGGIALTTSSTANAFSTNNSTNNSDFFLGNTFDKDLNQLNTGQTHDIVVFEFDFSAAPNYQGVLLEYQFASEEYPDYVGSVFNDLFGFFVSDPNGQDPNIPDGDTDNDDIYNNGETPAINLALVPGTTNFVSINNINVGSPGSQASNPPLGDFTQGANYINNGHAADDGDSATPIPANLNNGAKPLNIEFNGATIKLKTRLNLIAGVTYHMKMAIADLGDDSFDSGVFISGVKGLAIIEARNDQGFVTENIGGVAVQNVLINDDYAGNPNPAVADVELIQISSTNPGVTLNTNTGAVSVAPGTPVGFYELEYNVCDPSPDNCSTATVFVSVLEDSDNDGITDGADLDDDNDGILDTVECTNISFSRDLIIRNALAGNFTVVEGGASGTPYVTDAGPNNNEVGLRYIDQGANPTFYRLNTGSKDFTYVDGNNLVFRLFVQDPGEPFFGGTSDIRLGSGATQLILDLTEAPFGQDKPVGVEDFTITVPLTAANFGVTQAVFSNVLASLDYIDVRAEFWLGPTATVESELIPVLNGPCDFDNDGITDTLDTDSDNDGCPDAIEAAASLTLDKLATLAGGSAGGSSKNLGINADVDGSPIVNGQGTAGFTQNTTTAVLDTSQNIACTVDLKITKTVDKAVLKIGQALLFKLVLTNEGLQPVTNVLVKDLLPTDLTFNSGTTIVPANTTYTASSGIWNLSTLIIVRNQTIELIIGATVNNVGTIITNNAEVRFATETDIDSTPNNNN